MAARPRGCPDSLLDDLARSPGCERRLDRIEPGMALEVLRRLLSRDHEVRVAAGAPAAAGTVAVVHRVVAIPPVVRTVLLPHPTHHDSDARFGHRPPSGHEYERPPVVVCAILRERRISRRGEIDVPLDLDGGCLPRHSDGLGTRRAGCRHQSCGVRRSGRCDGEDRRQAERGCCCKYGKPLPGPRAVRSLRHWAEGGAEG